jgi:hypothetical protein
MIAKSMGIFKKSFKLLFLGLLITVVLLSFFGCTKIVFIPGVSNGYYIWKDKLEKIHIAWSMERNKAIFNGWIATDGKIIDYDKIGFSEDDTISLNSEGNKLEFNAPITENELSQEIIIEVKNYSYLEFELKINDGYDLERTHVGEYLANPKSPVFRISRDYFDELRKIPFYRKPPYSGLFYKLSTDIAFTMIFIFILGVIAIEIIRITVIRRNRKYNWYLILCYGVLILIDFGIYLFLTRLYFV